MAFFQTVKRGQRYLERWPLHPKLAAIFPENRVIIATRFAQKAMPFLAVFAVVWQQLFAKGNNVAFSAAILTALFALCLPFQGLYWLGKRANTKLPPQSAVKFQEIFSRLQEKQVTLTPIEQPGYGDLADLLQKAEKHLGASFWDDL